MTDPNDTVTGDLLRQCDDSPYQDGYNAGMRTGKYAGARWMPECPHAEGTQDYADWQRGFEDATGDLWDPVIQGWGDNP